MKANADEPVQTLKKIVAISVAGLAAALVATWRRVRTENAPPESEIAMESGIPLSESPPEPPVSRSITPSGASETSSRAELYEIAQSLGVEGRSKMNKQQLLAAIRAAG